MASSIVDRGAGAVIVVVLVKIRFLRLVNVQNVVFKMIVKLHCERTLKEFLTALFNEIR